jgi:hypothetical protein
MSVSIEFLTLISLVIILAILTLSFNFYYYQSYLKQKIFIELKNTAETIASEINLAVKVGDGYSHTFYLKKPKYVGDLSLQIDNYLVKLKTEDLEVLESILTKNITGNFKFDSFNQIKNLGGKIYVD